MAGLSSVFPSFWERETDINEYLIFIISCVAASSRKLPPAVIIGTAASCPADVTFVIEIRTVSNTESPFPTEKIPNAKATDK